jgi:pimeloyl-ACP methyl ester carboxylesterase
LSVTFPRMDENTSQLHWNYSKACRNSLFYYSSETVQCSGELAVKKLDWSLQSTSKYIHTNLDYHWHLKMSPYRQLTHWFSYKKSVQIKGAGHGLMYQYPEQFNEIVKTFLEILELWFLIYQWR